MKTDEHGQPIIRYRGEYNVDRSIDELIGLSRGLLADGVLNDNEIIFLHKWLEANEHCVDTWPANIIFERIQNILADGVIDSEERQDLFSLLTKLTSGTLESGTATSDLPLDDPQPIIEFEDNIFCVTGRFALGPRNVVTELIENKGGIISKGLTKKVNYLIIGTIGSQDWIHSSYGRKIEKAISYRETDGKPHIISEDHFVASVY